MSLQALVGNQLARDRLRQILAADRLPHALLIHGPAGIGKTLLAEAVARALLCPNADPDACDVCEVCRRAREGLHPDLHRIEPDGRFVKVEQARELVRSSFMRAYEGRAKVFLLPQADRCNDESANILLKTLEEPPPSTYLLLVTATREAVLPTLRSRCHAIEMRPLTREELRTVLIEAHGLDAAEAEVRARLGRGSASIASSLDIERLREDRGRATEALLPLARGQLSGADADRVIKLAEALARKGAPLEEFLFGTLRTLARDALVLAAGADDQLLSHVDDPDNPRALAAALGASGSSELLAEIDQAEADMIYNVNKKLVIESLFLGVFERARATGQSPTL